MATTTARWCGCRKGDTEGTRADLTKFLELSPNAPEAPAAKKALEQLKK